MNALPETVLARRAGKALGDLQSLLIHACCELDDYGCTERVKLLLEVGVDLAELVRHRVERDFLAAYQPSPRPPLTERSPDSAVRICKSIETLLVEALSQLSTEGDEAEKWPISSAADLAWFGEHLLLTNAEILARATLGETEATA